MAASGWRHGKNVGPLWDRGPVGLRYLSPSAITLATDSQEGCPRKWFWQYVGGIKQPETESQRIGTALHAELEAYVLTGKRDLSALALAGLHAVPTPPWDDVGVEVDMGSAFSDPEAAFAVAEAAALRDAGDPAGAARMLEPFGILTAAGVPILGRIDLIHARCTNQGAEDASQAYDPPNTVEVLDYKTTSDIGRYAKSALELGYTPQMLAYANWVLISEPTVERVRISHLYFQTRGAKRTRKVSTILERAVLRERWLKVEAVAAELAQVARATSEADVRANTDACNAFGGCPHRGVRCSAGTVRTLRTLRRKPEAASPPPNPTATTGDFVHMSAFLDKIKKKNDEKAGAAAGAAPKATPDPKFAEAYTTLEQANEAAGEIGAEAYGIPILKGAAAEQRCLMTGHEFKGAALSGSKGTISGFEIESVADFLQLVAEVSGDITEKVATWSSAAPDPAEPVHAAEVAAAAAAPKVSPLPPDAAKPDPATASAGPAGAVAAKRTRAAKPKADAPAQTTPAAVAATKVDAQAGGAAGPEIYVDGAPARGVATILGGWVRDLWHAFAAEAGCDPRIHPEKPLAFGGWRAVWEERVARAAGELGPGVYVFLPRGEVEESAVPGFAVANGVALVVGGRR